MQGKEGSRGNAMNPVFLQARYWVLLEFVKLILFFMNTARLVHSFWPDMDKLVEFGEDGIPYS